jgi:hypothetical protein
MYVSGSDVLFTVVTTSSNTVMLLMLLLAVTSFVSPPPPPTPTGEGGSCPYFSSEPGGLASGAGQAVCAPPSAVRKWQSLKFGLFIHWGAYSQIGFDASWSLNWKTVCQFGNPTLCAPKNCSECTHADMVKFRKM